MFKNLKITEQVKPLAIERDWRYQVHQPETVMWCEPSRTIQPTFIELLNKGKGWLSEHHNRTGHSEADVAKNFARLYSVTSRTFDESFSCEIPDALLVGREGLVITPQSEALVQSMIFGGAVGTKLAAVRAMAGATAPEPLSGSYVSLRAYADQNFGHWLLDVLPRLALDSTSDPSLKVILPPDPLPFQVESLKLLGFSEDRMVETSETTIAVEKLIFCCASPKINVPIPAHFLNIITQLVEAAVRNDPLTRTDRRLFISRSRGRRPIVNENELLPILNRWDFEVIYPHEYTVKEQIRLFAEANVVLGPHGAGNCTHAFCRPGATVIEIFNEHFWQLAVWQSCSVLNHRHWHMFAENLSRDYHTHVDPAILDALLSAVLKTTA